MKDTLLSGLLLGVFAVAAAYGAYGYSSAGLGSTVTPLLHSRGGWVLALASTAVLCTSVWCAGYGRWIEAFLLALTPMPLGIAAGSIVLLISQRGA